MTRQLKSIYIGTSFIPSKDRLIEFDNEGFVTSDATEEEIAYISRFLLPENLKVEKLAPVKKGSTTTKATTTKAPTTKSEGE